MTYNKAEWQWWKDSLAGKNPPMHANTPMQGYYAYRASANAPVQPVAFWYKDDVMLCKVGKTNVDYGLDVWMGAGRNPITYADYKLVAIEDQPWPHEIIIVDADGKEQSSLQRGMGDNIGDDPFIVISGNIDNWVATAEKLKKKGPPKTQVEANAISDVATKLAELQKEATAARVTEKEPHKQKVEEVDGKWMPVVRKAEVYKDLKALIQKFLNAEDARRVAEAKKLQDELNKDKPDDGGTGVVVQAQRATAGTRRSVTMVKRKVVKFTDLKKTAEYFASMEEPPAAFIEAMTTNAYRILMAGAPVPGAKLEEKEFVR